MIILCCQLAFGDTRVRTDTLDNQGDPITPVSATISYWYPAIQNSGLQGCLINIDSGN